MPSERASRPIPGVTLSDLDAIAYSLVPDRRLALIGGDPYEIDDGDGLRHQRPVKRNSTGASWAFRAFWPAPPVMNPWPRGFTSCRIIAPTPRVHSIRLRFAQAAILVVDGIGETSTAWLGRGSPSGLEEIEEIPYPHSIGMLWERVAVYLGFTEFDACKVMGLAALGDPSPV